jgi:hypothetical protein
MSWWKREWFFCLLLAVVTMLAYQPAWHGGFIWDDDRYVTNNKLLTEPDGLRRIWFSLDSPSQYFPLVYTTFRTRPRRQRSFLLSRTLLNRTLKFRKRGQLLIRAHNETLSIAAMRVSNKDRSPARIHGRPRRSPNSNRLY